MTARGGGSRSSASRYHHVSEVRVRGRERCSMTSFPGLFKDVMQVPLHLVGGRNRQVRIPGGRTGRGGRGPPVALCGWNLENGDGGLESGAGLGEKATRDRQVGPGLGPDPGVQHVRKILVFRTTRYLPPHFFWIPSHWHPVTLLDLGSRTGLVFPPLPPLSAP